MRIDWLCACPHHVVPLARAHVRAFGALQPGWGLAEATAELQAHDRPHAIPSTLVALDAAGDWLGSVSLLRQDHPDIPQHSPWLASLYVRPQVRRSGLGPALVRRAVAEAAALGVDRLYLYCTATLAGWYRGLGWRHRQSLQLGPLALQVLSIDCAEHA